MLCVCIRKSSPVDCIPNYPGIAEGNTYASLCKTGTARGFSGASNKPGKEECGRVVPFPVTVYVCVCLRWEFGFGSRRFDDKVTSRPTAVCIGRPRHVCLCAGANFACVSGSYVLAPCLL